MSLHTPVPSHALPSYGLEHRVGEGGQSNSSSSASAFVSANTHDQRSGRASGAAADNGKGNSQHPHQDVCNSLVPQPVVVAKCIEPSEPPPPPDSPPPPKSPAPEPPKSSPSPASRHPPVPASVDPRAERRSESHPPPPMRRRVRLTPVVRECNAVYQKIEQCGEGTYGEVFKAVNRETKELVALKRLRMDTETEGFPITAIREIKILKSLKHDNIVSLKEIVTSKASSTSETRTGSIYMVFEYLDHDLFGMLSSGVRLRPVQVKTYLKQLLEGVAYMHLNNIMHRDIKGSNLLIGNDGKLKIGDWGLARPWNERRATYTNRVITLWYRPPELLLGCTGYTTAVDMWSVGCIFAELLAQKPILPGKDEIDQLTRIFKLVGHPTPANFEGLNQLPKWHVFQPTPGQELRPAIRSTFAGKSGFSSKAVDLLERMLCLDPKKRITAQEALDHLYLWEDPLPDPACLPKLEGSLHEYQVKNRLHQPQQRAQQQYEQQQQRASQQQHHSSGSGGGGGGGRRDSGRGGGGVGSSRHHSHSSSSSTSAHHRSAAAPLPQHGQGGHGQGHVQGRGGGSHHGNSSAVQVPPPQLSSQRPFQNGHTQQPAVVYPGMTGLGFPGGVGTGTGASVVVVGGGVGPPHHMLQQQHYQQVQVQMQMQVVVGERRALPFSTDVGGGGGGAGDRNPKRARY